MAHLTRGIATFLVRVLCRIIGIRRGDRNLFFFLLLLSFFPTQVSLAFNSTRWIVFPIIFNEIDIYDVSRRYVLWYAISNSVENIGFSSEQTIEKQSKIFLKVIKLYLRYQFIFFNLYTLYVGLKFLFQSLL